MIVERVVLISLWVISCGLLIIIPSNKRRIAIVAFLFEQATTRLFGVVVVELGLVSYPVRLFSDVNRTSFSFEYLIYPTIGAVFISFYPEKSARWKKLTYFFSFPTLFAIIIAIIEHYTELITFIHWNWFLNGLSILLAFFLTRRFCLFFFREDMK